MKKRDVTLEISIFFLGMNCISFYCMMSLFPKLFKSPVNFEDIRSC